MKRQRFGFVLLVAALLVAGVFLTWYRHVTFEVPFLPGERRQVWSVEAQVDFVAMGNAVTASLAVPDSQPGFERIGEHTASPGYGLAFVERGSARRAEWSIRRAEGRQTLYYRVDMMVAPDTLDEKIGVPPPVRQVVRDGGPQATAAAQLLQNAEARSANPYTLARELIHE